MRKNLKEIHILSSETWQAEANLLFSVEKIDYTPIFIEFNVSSNVLV